MPNEELKKQEVLDEDEQFINSLLGVDDEEEEAKKAEETQRIKNKNAEEARKRREAEAKLANEETTDEVVEEEASEEVVEEAKEEEVVAKPVEEVKEKPKEENVNRLGEQLVQFKNKYPQIDLEQLDNDKAFKRYIDGKLLGNKDFTQLYEDFVEMKAEIQGVESNTIERNYIKAQSSSGTSTSTSTTSSDVFSEEEMRKLAQRIPLMNPKDVAKIEEKLNRSITYYENR